MVNGDILSAVGLGNLLPAGSIGSAITAVQTSLSGVSTALSIAGPLVGNISGLNSVYAKINTAQTATLAAQSLNNGNLSGTVAIGGQVAGAYASTNASNLTNALVNMTQMANLQQIGSFLNRAGRNVSGARAS